MYQDASDSLADLGVRVAEELKRVGGSEFPPSAPPGYASLGLAVLDSIWSLGVRYSSVRRVVQHYCEIAGIENLPLTQHAAPEPRNAGRRNAGRRARTTAHGPRATGRVLITRG